MHESGLFSLLLFDLSQALTVKCLNHYLTSSSKREVPKVIDHDNKPFTLSAEGVLYSEKSNDKKVFYWVLRQSSQLSNFKLRSLK